MMEQVVRLKRLKHSGFPGVTGFALGVTLSAVVNFLLRVHQFEAHKPGFNNAHSLEAMFGDELECTRKPPFHNNIHCATETCINETSNLPQECAMHSRCRHTSKPLTEVRDICFELWEQDSKGSKYTCCNSSGSFICVHEAGERGLYTSDLPTCLEYRWALSCCTKLTFQASYHCRRTTWKRTI